MPVIDHPVHPHGIRNADYRYGCHNRPHFHEVIEVQDGWHDDGTRRTVKILFRMSTECRYDMSITDSGCKDCKHADTGHRYVKDQAAKGAR